MNKSRIHLGRELTFCLEAHGHANITSTHPTTIELTKDQELSPKGDCIVGVRTSHGLLDLPKEMRELFKTDAGRGRLVLKLGKDSFTFEGRGATGLTLSHPTEIVVRKSGFLSARTLMVHSNNAARDLPIRFVDRLRDPSQTILVDITAWHA